MADNQTEKQKVQELTDKLERGLTELFNSDSYKNYLSTRVCEEKSVNVIFYDNDWAEGSQMSIQPLLYI